ncbi:MAG: VRR-NUC domain-containing protein [Methylomicrobium sp.]|nr:VRR-NUC domain-containing protein [Methylomicrobium sp.]
MRESKIEKALRLRVRELGGLCEKFTSPGNAGVPDRIVTLPWGRIIFVELKAPGKKPSKLQAFDHRRRRALGCTVVVIDSLELVKRFPEESC